MYLDLIHVEQILSYLKTLKERIEINRVVLGFYNIFTVMFLPVFSLAYSAYI